MRRRCAISRALNASDIGMIFGNCAQCTTVGYSTNNTRRCHYTDLTALMIRKRMDGGNGHWDRGKVGFMSRVGPDISIPVAHFPTGGDTTVSKHNNNALRLRTKTRRCVHLRKIAEHYIRELN